MRLVDSYISSFPIIGAALSISKLATKHLKRLFTNRSLFLPHSFFLIQSHMFYPSFICLVTLSSIKLMKNNIISNTTVSFILSASIFSLCHWFKSFNSKYVNSSQRVLLPSHPHFLHAFMLKGEDKFSCSKCQVSLSTTLIYRCKKCPSSYPFLLCPRCVRELSSSQIALTAPPKKVLSANNNFLSSNSRSSIFPSSWKTFSEAPDIILGNRTLYSLVLSNFDVILTLTTFAFLSKLFRTFRSVVESQTVSLFSRSIPDINSETNNNYPIPLKSSQRQLNRSCVKVLTDRNWSSYVGSLIGIHSVVELLENFFEQIYLKSIGEVTLRIESNLSRRLLAHQIFRDYIAKNDTLLGQPRQSILFLSLAVEQIIQFFANCFAICITLNSLLWNPFESSQDTFTLKTKWKIFTVCATIKFIQMTFGDFVLSAWQAPVSLFHAKPSSKNGILENLLAKKAAGDACHILKTSELLEIRRNGLEYQIEEIFDGIDGDKNKIKETKFSFIESVRKFVFEVVCTRTEDDKFQIWLPRFIVYRGADLLMLFCVSRVSNPLSATLSQSLLADSTFYFHLAFSNLTEIVFATVSNLKDLFGLEEGLIRELTILSAIPQLEAIPIDPCLGKPSTDCKCCVCKPLAQVPNLSLNSSALLLSIENVDFSYNPSMPPILRQVTFDVRAGEIISLVGPSGCGKSSLCRLLCCLYLPTSGNITFHNWDGLMENTCEQDGSRVRNFRQRGLLAIPQMMHPIGKMTLHQNLVYGNPSILNIASNSKSAASSRAVVDKSALDDILWQVGLANKLKEVNSEGHNTAISTFQFSGGEMQRVAIARHLLRTEVDRGNSQKNTKIGKIWVLDESTNALDVKSENEVLSTIFDAVQNLQQDAVVVATHRRQIAALSDKVIFLVQGQIIDVGRHDVLMSRCDSYRRFFTINNVHQLKSPANYATGKKC